MPKEQIFEIKKQEKPEVPIKETEPEIVWSPEATKEGEKLVKQISSLKQSLDQAEAAGDLKTQEKILDQITPLTERLEVFAKKERGETEIIAKTKEGLEIVFNLEQERTEWQKWYQEHNLKLEGLFLKDYLIIQRKFTEETEITKDIQDQKRHLDADNWIWCLKSSFPSSGRLARVYWYPYGHRLSVRAGSPSGSFLGRGARLGRGFEF